MVMLPLDTYRDIALHMGSAVLAGGLIGLERSYHGRPAGFRTHTLVCLASSVLMLVTVYQGLWFMPGQSDIVRVDPTRMAQGIMTGIGFLGAGVIFKEGLSVRGLTTAASIWMTASIGILTGVGFYAPAAAATVLTLGVLELFRTIERYMPSSVFALHVVRFARAEAMPEADLRTMLTQHGFSVANLNYRLDGDAFEYRMMLRTQDTSNLPRLAHALSKLPQVLEYRLAPTGD